MLLKNEGQVLPLKKGSSVAVLGPHSDGHDVFLSSKHQENVFVGTSFWCKGGSKRSFVGASLFKSLLSKS